MRALLQLMAAQHGVASTTQARALGVSRRTERRLLDAGVVHEVAPGVLAAGGVRLHFAGRAMAGVLATGVIAVSHGAAARLHQLDGFGGHDTIDVLATRGANPRPGPGVVVHRTRARVDGHVEQVAGIPVLSVAATLALLAPVAGIGPTARALDAALRRGVDAGDLRRVAEAWRRRGRSGPPALLMLLGDRVDADLPSAWFRRVAGRVLAATGVRLVAGHQVRDERGTIVADLALADPARRVGVDAQSWRRRATAGAQHDDAQRRRSLHRLGWDVVDVWWSDLRDPDRVAGQLVTILRARAVLRASRSRA